MLSDESRFFIFVVSFFLTAFTYALNDSTGVSGFDSLEHATMKAAIEIRKLENRKRMVKNFAIHFGYALEEKVYRNERSVRNKWNAKK
jgi:hypothetical protein